MLPILHLVQELSLLPSRMRNFILKDTNNTDDNNNDNRNISNNNSRCVESTYFMLHSVLSTVHRVCHGLVT